MSRLVQGGLLVASHKVVFFRDEIKWCGRLYSGKATISDPDRVQMLFELRLLETESELMHLIHTASWLRPSCQNWSNLNSHYLCGLMGECLQGTKRIRRAADRWRIGGS